MSTLNLLPVATATPPLKLAQPLETVNDLIETAQKAAQKGVCVLVFPELSLTGYTCGDLFFQPALHEATEKAVEKLAEASKQWENLLIFVGLPIIHQHALYNCALAIHAGRLCAFIPKTYLPNTGEFYEKRWFTPYQSSTNEPSSCCYAGQTVPFGQGKIQYQLNGTTYWIGCEICEDLWAPQPVSTQLALSGCEVIVNLSASNELIGKTAYRRQLVLQQSARLNAAYVYSGAGTDESSTDLVLADMP